MSLSRTDLVMALTVPLVWGMGFVFAKGAIEHFPPILLMCLRFTLTALVLVWFTAIPRGNLLRLCGVAVVACAIQYSLTFTGLKGLQAGIASLIVQLEVPFLVMLGAVFLGERPGRRKWLGIAIAFAGVGLMAHQGDFGADVVSVLMVVGGAFTWAVGQVMIRALKDIAGLQVTAWTAVFAAPQLLVMSLVFESGQSEALQAAGPVVWGAVLYLGLVMTGFGYFLWNSLIRKHDVGRVAPFLLLLPVFSVLGGILFLGETPDPARLWGGLVILFGVAVITLNPAQLRLRLR